MIKHERARPAYKVRNEDLLPMFDDLMGMRCVSRLAYGKCNILACTTKRELIVLEGYEDAVSGVILRIDNGSQRKHPYR